MQIFEALVGLIAAIGAALTKGWNRAFPPGATASQTVRTEPMLGTQPLPTTNAYTPQTFDDRAGLIEVCNTSLDEFRVTHWHPDDAARCWPWVVAGWSLGYRESQDQTFAIGKDWGVLFDRSEIRSVGRAARRQNGEWLVSQDSYDGAN